jgi:hypothetical protein
MRQYLYAACVALLSGAPSVAQATVVQWQLNDLVFEKANKTAINIFGNFGYDDATKDFSNINISTYYGTSCCSAGKLETASRNASFLKISVWNLYDDFSIDLASAMTSAGGTIALTSGTSSNGWTLRAGQSISAPTPRPTDTPTPVVSPVPEPTSWVLMIAGFAMMGGAMRRRSPIVRIA